MAMQEDTMAGAKDAASDAQALTASHPPSYDAGNLTIFDPAPLPPYPVSTSAVQSHEGLLRDRAQYCAQSLVSHLLKTCEIHTASTPEKEVLMRLPPTETPIPREKPLPKPKEKTRWEKFAEKKGIASKGRKDAKTNMVYDDAKQEWVPRWGYKGKNKDGEGQWLVEVDEKKDRALSDGMTIRGEGRRERKEKMKRQDRRERANERKARKGGAAV